MGSARACVTVDCQTSNLITLHRPRRSDTSTRQAALIARFAHDRRDPDNVYWLKENAELLNILASTGVRLPQESLQVFEHFYDEIEARLRFFPQYYRFLLSIALDLEDLGLPGDRAEGLCHAAHREGLAEAELSDLQRAEARHLLARRGQGPGLHSSALVDRLHGFISRSDTFGLPNVKAAYELTHIVFYLSGYGQRDPGLEHQALTSLRYAGTLAYLDQNMDLLAEVCVALRYAGEVPGAVWEQAVENALHQFRIEADPRAPLDDGYHAYFVTNWLAALTGADPFPAEVPTGRVTVLPGQGVAGILRTLSESLCAMGEVRNGDWDRMAPWVGRVLTPDQQDVLTGAEQSCPDFHGFFRVFARASAMH